MRYPQRRLDSLALLVVAAWVWAGVSSASASTQLAAPFASIYVESGCAGQAAYVGSANTGRCEVRPTASAAAGQMAAELTLVSPLSGTAAWSAGAHGTGGVVATYRLTHPAKQLDLKVAIHVNHATTSLGDGLVDHWASTWATNALPPSITGHSVSIDVGAHATEAQCSPNCVVGAAAGVISQWTPGTVTSTDKDYVLELTLRNDCTGWMAPGTPCGELPVGDVTVTPNVAVYAGQPNSWGSMHAIADATVTAITVE